MNEIKPTYVSFEQAKRLKEKGFDLYLNAIYKTDGTLVENVNLTKVEKLFPAPEQWQVVEWLRVKHGIWVFPDPVFDFSEWTSTAVIKGSISMLWRSGGHKTPQQAYSAAFNYILTNLI